MSSTASKEAIALQRKLFSRYCNQKLSMSRNIKVSDIVDASAKNGGLVLLNLLEVLSEVEYDNRKKLNDPPKMRVHAIECVPPPPPAAAFFFRVL